MKGTITVRLSTDDTEKAPDDTPQTDAIPVSIVGQSESGGIADADNIIYSESTGATDAKTKATQPGDLGMTLESISANLDGVIQIADAISTIHPYAKIAFRTISSLDKVSSSSRFQIHYSKPT
ncbi:hypothetical protein PILCRDRAFT_394277 [Piloderma croceum F 1598]|uniref:Uncharacterized protein n=1 Tax=Piloderma croceum (strain F 1598) TaxID=765440 RepID=A0A0C3FYI9_PILCF|nr:hypothetical protein PILCRDRAFT_394277 [Piloderma croceum F 1598]